MITGDILVYGDPDGRHYVGSVDNGEQWWRWPAERHGWRLRARCDPSYAERCEEMEPRLGWLAVLLSGVERG